MLIHKDSSSYRRAVEKQFRLLPDMYKMRVEFVGSRPFITRRVVGSRGHVYTVRIWNDGVSCFESSCDCRAGFEGFVCYHVAAVYEDFRRAKTDGQVYPLEIIPHAFFVENVFVY